MKKNILMKKVFAIGTSVAMFTCVFAFAGGNIANAAEDLGGTPVAAEAHKKPDFNKLRTVPVTLVKEGTEDSPSMAAKAVEPLARFGEKNGHIGLFLTFKPLTLGNLTAGVRVLKVKQDDGTLKEAKIVEEKNGYPSIFHFHIDRKDQFVELTVNVKDGPMGDQDIPVRLKIDWSKESDPVPVEPEKKDPAGEVDKNKDKAKKDEANKDKNNEVAENNENNAEKDKMPKKPMSPKTADNSSVGLFAALGLGSLAVGASVRRKGEKR